MQLWITGLIKIGTSPRMRVSTNSRIRLVWNRPHRSSRQALSSTPHTFKHRFIRYASYTASVTHIFAFRLILCRNTTRTQVCSLLRVFRRCVNCFSSGYSKKLKLSSCLAITRVFGSLLLGPPAVTRRARITLVERSAQAFVFRYSSILSCFAVYPRCFSERVQLSSASWLAFSQRCRV